MNLIIFSTILKWLTATNTIPDSSWAFISSVFGKTFWIIALLGFSTRFVEKEIRFNEVGIVVWISSLLSSLFVVEVSSSGEGVVVYTW